MRPLLIAASAAVLLELPLTPLQVQSNPDFSGKWIHDAARGPATGGWGTEFSVAQDAKTLTITRRQGETVVTETYRLDGTESKNEFVNRGIGVPVVIVSKVAWDGSKLVISSRSSFNLGGQEQTIDTKRTLSLEGGTLVIEANVSGMPSGMPPAKAVYKRSPPAPAG